MYAGFQTYTEDAVLQVTSDVKMSNLVYSALYTGPFVTEDYRPYVPEVLYRFDVSVAIPLRFIFFKSTVGRNVFLKSRVGGVYRFLSTSNAPIMIYGFSEGMQAQSASGLQLFDANGNLTFDSDSNFMRIVDAVYKPASGLRKNWPNASKVYAAGLSLYPKRITGDVIPPGLGIYYLWSYGVWVGPSNYGATDSKIWFDSTGTETPPSPSPIMQPPTLVAIDVSNL